MANPPVNRRPGVDADIIQGTWVRGYDVPAGDQTLPVPSPCDLIISNGKSQIDQTLSNLIFANRTASLTQPVFVMAVGPDPTTPVASVNFHVGSNADPNGLISGVGPGSFYTSYGTPALWQLQSDNSTWVQISDDLGGEDLQQTLAIGNTTGGFNILLTNGDFLKGEDSSVGDGAGANIAGGNATGAAGNGGPVLIQSGTSVGGVTGTVTINSAASTSTGASGAFSFVTGESKLGGNSGGVTFGSGESGDVGLGGSGGAVFIRGGRSRSSGAGAFFGGNLFLNGGQATTSGNGGGVFIRAGASSDFDTFIALPAATPNTGGDVSIVAGASASTVEGGRVTLSGGAGGSGGGDGGSIYLNPGLGGGGAAKGQVIADGILTATNIKRGLGDPNGSVDGDEGDIYQRTSGGLGQLWINRNGTINGWSQLAITGDFLNSFEQMTYGYLSRSGANQGDTNDEQFSVVGTFEGADAVVNGAGIIGAGKTAAGPHLSLTAPNPGDYAGIDQETNSFAPLPFDLTQNNLLTFRARNTSSAGFIFIGLSQEEVADHAASPVVPGGRFLGFAMTGASTWRVVTGSSLFTQNLATSVTVASVAAAAEPHFFVIDGTDWSNSGTIRFYIFDPDLNLLSTTVTNSTLPASTDGLGLVVVNRNVISAGGTFFQISHATIVSDAATVAQGGGNGSAGNLALNEVLNNGNETGPTLIQVNQGSGLLGVIDDNAGDGATFSIFGGGTTLATNDTGMVTLSSGNAFGLGATNAGSKTGDTGVFSGNQFALASLGDTGDIRVWSGAHLGTDGTTGTVSLASGFFTNAGAGTRTQGDILIGPGTFAADTCTVTGEVIIKGGSSTLPGVTGGDVTIMSGENAGASGDTGDIIVKTFPANIAGTAGGIEITTGDGGGVSGDSGYIDIQTGDAIGGSTGAVAITTGKASAGTGGAILIAVGDSTVATGSDVTIAAGDTSAGGNVGGSINLSPGTGPSGDGVVKVNGKLTVTGIIDPTALVLDGQAVIPPEAVPSVGQGTLWIDNTGAPSKLIFTDDSGTPHDISSGGGATSLASLSDVSLGALAPGEVLTYNGVDWVNLPGVGGSPLATILGIGNTTGALPIVVSGSLGARITSDDDLILDPSAAAGKAVVIDGLRWPSADGLAGYVLTTNGAGQLSFQVGGGGGTGPSFAEAFSRMQWGSVQSSNDGGSTFKADGCLSSVTLTSSGAATISHDANGYFTTYSTAAAPNDSKGLEIEQLGPGVGIELQSLPIVSFKFDGPSLSTNVRFFVGLTDSPTIAGQTGSVAPVQRYVGLQIYTDVPQTTFQFVTDNATGVPTRSNTGVGPLGTAFELVIDGTTAGQVTLVLYDNTGTQLASHTFVANLPTATVGLGLQHGMTTTNAAAKTSSFYTITAVTRGDILNAAAGGGGNQDLASVLGFGAETGGTPIQGDNNIAGSAGDLDLLGGTSSGGGGAGGGINLATGSPDPGGIGPGGSITMATAQGAGTGDGGGFFVALGAGGAGGGDGGNYALTAGNGIGVGNGGSWLFAAGNSGAGLGAFAGSVSWTTGSGTGGSGATGGRYQIITGDGNGAGNGGPIQFNLGDGGAGGGDGGSFVVTPGTGNGGGSDGVILFNGDTTVDGKLTVTGLIDPTGLLMTSQGVGPFVPAGSDGGIWVNASGELIYTNALGDLNLSTAIGGGVTFLDALLTAGYGMLSAGNPSTGAESYGVYGSSVVSAVSPGPPPASITFSEDTDGPFLNFAVGAVAASEAFIGTADLFVRRDSQFRARFKFQVTSPAHTDERIFIGFTDDTALVTPSAQLAVDDPPGLQYMGLRQDVAGFNLNFVSRGSGGAIAPVFAIPTDASVHYLDIDCSPSTGDVIFTVVAADGTTVEATHTVPSSLLLPTLANPLRPFTGIRTDAGTTPRGIDFYYSTIVTRADIVDAVTGGGGMSGTPDLALVLAAGNDAAGIPIIANGGIEGGTVDLMLEGGSTGAAGSPASILLNTQTGDFGGEARIDGGPGAGLGGDGGRVWIQGGEAAGAGSTADGGDIRLVSGNAGDSGGNAGEIRLTGGDAQAANGVGGSVRISAGNSFGTAIGGGINLTAGDGGVGPGTGDGGRILLLAGSPAGTGAEGGIDIFAGGGLAPGAGEGAVQLVSSPVNGDGLTESWMILDRANPGTGDGGSVSIQAGRADVGSGGVGGNIVFQTQLGDGAGDAGSIHLLGDGAAVFPLIGAGGDIQLIAATDPTNTAGGFVVLDGGGTLIGGSASLGGGDAVAASGLPGGIASVTAGTGDGAADGGFALLRGGQAGATGDGGDAQVRGGSAAAGSGGDVRLIPGTGPAGDGLIQLEGKIDPAVGGGVAGLQYGTVTFPGPVPAASVIGFNTAFGAAPTTVQISIESSAAGLGGAGNDVTVTIAPGSIGVAGFTANFVAVGAIPGPLTLHWLAIA